MGFPPISAIGLGRISVSSLSLVPKPPARINTFILLIYSIFLHPVLQHYKKPQFLPANIRISGEKTIPYFFQMISTDEVPFGNVIDIFFTKPAEFVFHPF